MEARIARLESDVAHIRIDLADVKTDVRSLRDKLDAARDRIERLRDDMKRGSKGDDMNARFDTLKDSLNSAKVWALVLYVTFAGTMFGTMARGFGWI